MEQSEGLMAVVVLKFLGFLADVKGKEIFLLQKQTGSVLKKDFFYKLDKELYNISCSFPVWFVWLEQTCKIIMKPLVKYASLSTMTSLKPQQSKQTLNLFCTQLDKTYPNMGKM